MLKEGNYIHNMVQGQRIPKRRKGKCLRTYSMPQKSNEDNVSISCSNFGKNMCVHVGPPKLFKLQSRLRTYIHPVKSLDTLLAGTVGFFGPSIHAADLPICILRDQLVSMHVSICEEVKMKKCSVLLHVFCQFPIKN